MCLKSNVSKTKLGWMDVKKKKRGKNACVVECASIQLREMKFPAIKTNINVI